LGKLSKGSKNFAHFEELLEENFLIPEANSIHRPSLCLESDVVEISEIVKLLLLTTNESFHIVFYCVKASQYQIEN
jgi:hypothetical protein